MDQLKEEGYLDKLFSLIQARSKSFVDLGVIDQNGDHVVYVGPYQLKGVNYANEEWFEAAMLRGVFISDVFMGFRKFPHFIIAVSRREGNKTWILRRPLTLVSSIPWCGPPRWGREGTPLCSTVITSCRPAPGSETIRWGRPSCQRPRTPGHGQRR